MSAAVLLIAAMASPVQAAESAYPLDDVLAAFATACSTVEDPAVNRASIEAGGWEAYEPAEDSMIGRLIEIGRETIANEELAEGEAPTQMLDGATYRREIAGRNLHIVLSGVRIEEIRTTGCRLYDLDVTTEPDLEAVAQWARRAPDNTERPGAGMVLLNWNGGMKPGHFDMQLQFVRPGADFPLDIPFSGLVLTASDMEIDGL